MNTLIIFLILLAVAWVVLVLVLNAITSVAEILSAGFALCRKIFGPVGERRGPNPYDDHEPANMDDEMRSDDWEWLDRCKQRKPEPPPPQYHYQVELRTQGGMVTKRVEVCARNPQEAEEKAKTQYGGRVTHVVRR
jgi:hypothetical protein